MTTTKPLSKTAEARYQRLAPNGCPRYVRCYDDGKSIDRYTVTFPSFCIKSVDRRFPYREYPFLGMSSDPFHPQGFGQHGISSEQIDRPRYAHLGKRIAFHALPEDCQRLVLQDYAEYWNLPLDRLIADCLRPTK